MKKTNVIHPLSKLFTHLFRKHKISASTAKSIFKELNVATIDDQVASYLKKKNGNVMQNKECARFAKKELIGKTDCKVLSLSTNGNQVYITLTNVYLSQDSI